jgi:hypothetical protein
MNSGRIAVIVGVMCGLTFLSGLDNPVTWMLPLVIVVPFIAYPRLSKIYWLLIAFSALLVMYPFAAAWELCSLAQNAFNQTAVAHVLAETRSALLGSIFIIAFILAFYYAWIARQIADVEANRLRVFISLEQSQMSRRTLGIGYGLLLILAALAVCALILPYFVSLTSALLSSDFQGKLGWQNLLLDFRMGLTLIGGFILPWLALLIADIRRSVENEASSSKSR